MVKWTMTSSTWVLVSYSCWNSNNSHRINWVGEDYCFFCTHSRPAASGEVPTTPDISAPMTSSCNSCNTTYRARKCTCTSMTKTSFSRLLFGALRAEAGGIEAEGAARLGVSGSMVYYWAIKCSQTTNCCIQLRHFVMILGEHVPVKRNVYIYIYYSPFNPLCPLDFTRSPKCCCGCPDMNETLCTQFQGL